MIRLGYACVNTGLPSASRTCRIQNAAPERLLEISRQNLQALGRILRWNLEQGIFLFRISSGTIPFGSHPVNGLPWWEIFEPELTQLGEAIRHSGMRVSMHPGQYTVLSSPRSGVVRNAVADLVYHCRLLDAMELDASHKVIVHLGGAYGEKKAALERFGRVFEDLPSAVKCRLAVENDEKSYSAEEVLRAAERMKIPMVFDVFHHRCLPSFSGFSLAQILDTAASTWGEGDGPQKIHYSDPHPEKPAGAHSDRVDAAGFCRFWGEIRSFDLDLMLEVKDKERSVLELYRKIPELRGQIPPVSSV